MKYPVIKRFRDKYTKAIYLPGKIIELDEETRINDLQNRKLIGEAIEEPKPEPTQEPKHIGGGMYELPTGERVKGKQAALDAMNGSDEDD